MSDPAPGAPLEALARRKETAADRLEERAAALRAEAKHLQAEARVRFERRKAAEASA